MKRILHPLVSLALLTFCLFCAASHVRHLNSKTSAATLKPADAETQAKVNQSYGRLPLNFEINLGQADPSIKFISRGANYNFSLAPTEATLQFRDVSTNQPATLRMKPVNANPSPKIEGMDQLPGKSNYLIGADQKQWRTDIPNYARVRYEKLWPGVDAVFYGNQQRLEYDFVIAPGADPRAIRLSFEGAKKISVDENGDLILSLAGRELRQLKPVVYQEMNGEKRPVAGRYIVRGGKVGFEVGRYDRSRELVIDPVLVYAARVLTGGAIAVDGQGAVYIAGAVTSSFSDFARGSDVSIVKLSPDGSQQVYNTIIGGSGSDGATGIAVSATGNIYVAGATSSTDFPLNPSVPNTKAGAGICFKSVNGGGAWNNSGRGLIMPQFGALSSLVIDPSNPSVIYAEDAQTNSTGLFKSLDGGNQWTYIKLTGVAEIKPLAVAPGDPSTLFVSTRQGLRKSSDGGVTLSATGLDRPGVRSLIIDRDNPDNLYATDGNAVFKSTDGGNEWSMAINGLPANIAIKSLLIDPANPSTLYVALRSNAALSDGAYKSVDRAANWVAVSAPSAETNFSLLAVHPTNSTVYAGTREGVFTSGDSGQSFQLTGLKDVAVASLVIDPINISTIYALTFIGTQGGSRDILKSTDAGTTWKSVGGILKRSNIGVLAIDPLNPDTIYAGTNSNLEAFVLKFDPVGQKLIYATYYGGAGDETVSDIVIDLAGNAYLTGAISPRPDAFGATVGDGPTPPLVNNLPVTSGQGFMAKVNPQGVNILYSTLLEGAGRDIALDSAGKAYVTGGISPVFQMTVKNGFKTSQEEGSSLDGYVVKLDTEKAGEESLLYSTYLGGVLRDEGVAIAVDSSGQVYVAGSSERGFSVPGRAISGAFVVKIDPSKSGASSLVWNNNLVPDGVANDVAVDADGDVYIVGETKDDRFPVTPGAYQTSLSGGVCGRIPVCNPPPQMPCGCMFPPKPGCPTPTSIDIPCADVFVMKVNTAGTTLLYSTYLGNKDTEEAGGSIVVDAAKNVYITGSGRVPFTEGAFQDGSGGGFIAKLTLTTRNTSATTVSAANYQGPQLAQESLAVSFLDAFGAGSVNLRAKVRDSAGEERDATVFFSGSGQVNFQIPPGTAIGNAMASITSNGAAIANGAFQVVQVAPGVFSADSSGAGLASAVAQRQTPDGAVTYEAVLRFDPAQNKIVAVPIDFGPQSDRVFLAIFGTGWRFRSSISATKVTIDGIEVPALYVGAQTTFNGLDQLNVELPRSLAGKGEVDLKVTVGDKIANTTRVAFK